MQVLLHLMIEDNNLQAHIDEELYTRTTYENETDMKLYVKKVISTLYNYYTPTFSPNFTYEYETGHAKLMKLAYQQDS